MLMLVNVNFQGNHFWKKLIFRLFSEVADEEFKKIKKNEGIFRDNLLISNV